MSDQTMPDVYCSFLGGQWYVSGSYGGGLMISGPTLTEAIAAYVVALAHGGSADAGALKLSPLYGRPFASYADDTAEHPADGWRLLDPAEDEWVSGDEEDPTAE